MSSSHRAWLATAPPPLLRHPRSRHLGRYSLKFLTTYSLSLKSSTSCPSGIELSANAAARRSAWWLVTLATDDHRSYRWRHRTLPQSVNRSGRAILSQPARGSPKRAVGLPQPRIALSGAVDSNMFDVPVIGCGLATVSVDIALPGRIS